MVLTRRFWTATVLAAVALTTSACTHGEADAMALTHGGNAARGKELIRSYGCGSCHTIPGIEGARGLVGPPLFFMGRRTMIAGELPNSPENMVRWLQSPQSVEPGTAMPTLGLTDQQARDAAAYLYTLQSTEVR